MAALNRGGVVIPPLATTCCNTDPAPADCPQIVTFDGSPPNLDILLLLSVYRVKQVRI